MNKRFFLSIFCISFIVSVHAQYDYWWWGNTDGNWNTSTNWNTVPGTATSGNPGNIKINNSSWLSMNNNITSLNIHALYFLSGTPSRTISGNGIQFYDNGGNDPRIKNETTNDQTINVDITGDGDAADPLILEAHSGDLIFKKINNNGSPLWNNSDNGNTVEFTDVVSGSGNYFNKNNTYAKFSAANTLSGDLYIDEGEVWIEQGGSFNNLSALYVGSTSKMADNAKLFLSDLNGGTTFSNAITISNGNTDTRYIGGINTSGTNTFSGNITLNRYVNVEVTNANGTVEFSGVISGAHGVDKIGGGTAIFSGSNTYTGATTVKAGKLTVNTGGTLGNNSDIEIKSGGTLEINTNTTVDDLNINSGGTLTIGSGVTLTVNGTLTLGDDINLSSGNLVLGSSATISGAGSSSYIVANGSGTFKRNVGTTAVEFPVGTSSSYMPIEINTSAGTADFEVRMQTNSYANAASYLNTNWVISSSSSPTIDLTFTWPSSEEGASFPSGNINLHKDGTPLTYNISKSGSGPYSASYTGVSCCGQFSPGGAGTVPVELTKFDVMVEEGLNTLYWETASELNNHFFEVERSLSDMNFESIGTVYGKGTTQEISTYHYDDQALESTEVTYYYRLKQVDFDGSYSYSPVVVARRDIQGFYQSSLSANPNPIRNEVELQLNHTFNADLRIEITAQNGAIILDKIAPFKDGAYLLNTSDFPRGVYHAKVYTDRKMYVAKLVKID